MKRILILLTLAVCLVALQACDTLNITGGFETPYGSISSDGRTVAVRAKLPDQAGLRK